MLLSQSKLLLTLVLVFLQSVTSFKFGPVVKFKPSPRQLTYMNLDEKRGLKGYYTRPSRAIEKGGGFFIPGLQEERIRLISAAVLLVLFVINRNGSPVASFSQSVSELTGVFASILLFLEGVISKGIIQINNKTSANSAFLTVLKSDKTFNSEPKISTMIRYISKTCPNLLYVLCIDRNTSSTVIELGPSDGNDDSLIAIVLDNVNVSVGKYMVISSQEMNTILPSFLADSHFLIFSNESNFMWVVATGKKIDNKLIESVVSLSNFD